MSVLSIFFLASLLITVSNGVQIKYGSKGKNSKPYCTKNGTSGIISGLEPRFEMSCDISEEWGFVSAVEINGTNIKQSTVSGAVGNDQTRNITVYLLGHKDKNLRWTINIYANHSNNFFPDSIHRIMN